MKKFLTTLIILIIIAGAGLFFGWAQFGIPPDAYGVIRSKTHGLYPHLVKPGEFLWLWYKLIPTNTATTVLRVNNVSYDFNTGNSLPSGKIYSTFAGIDGDFSWRINASITFRIKADAIIPLFSENIINSQDDLTLYEKNITGQIEGFILRRIEQDENSGQVEDLLKNGENSWFNGEIMREFPFLQNFSFKIKSAVYPDFTLYRQAKSLFDDYMTVQKEYASGSIRENVKSRIDSKLHYDELELYGVLLTKYPILLEYISLENKKN